MVDVLSGAAARGATAFFEISNPGASGGSSHYLLSIECVKQKSRTIMSYNPTPKFFLTFFQISSGIF
jgi:hypothetical protein